MIYIFTRFLIIIITVRIFDENPNPARRPVTVLLLFIIIIIAHTTHVVLIKY